MPPEDMRDEVGGEAEGDVDLMIPGGIGSVHTVNRSNSVGPRC